MMRNPKLPQDIYLNIDTSVFNKKFLPYLNKFFEYEVYYGGQGSGKCLGRGTKVVMYTGELRAVEDICVGDLLMGTDSTPRTVLSVCSGVDELYNVHQNKGMDYIVNSQHILSLKKAKSCRKTELSKQRYTSYPAFVDMPVQEYLKQSKRWRGRFYGYRVGVEFPKKDVEIDPYFLGVWLGDGTSSCLNITTEDAEIKEYVYQYAQDIDHIIHVGGQKGRAGTYCISKSGYGYPQYIREEWAKAVAECPNTPHSGIRSMQYLCKKTGMTTHTIIAWKKQKDFIDMVEKYRNTSVTFDASIIAEYMNRTELKDVFVKYNLFNNKHIPEDYLHNTKEIRMQVLAGLLDTDGSLHGNCYDIVQKNKRLTEQIMYLAHSLGFRCSMQECQKTCCNNGVVGTYYRLNISGNTQNIPVKIARKKVVSYNKMVDADVTGLSVEPIGNGEYFGFVIDGDHRFLLEDFTVTHNSFFISQKKVLQLTVTPKRNMICLRKQSTDCYDSCWGQMLTAIEQLKLSPFWNVNRSDHILRNVVNGNCIYFDGVDKIENIKSFKPEKGNLTDVWYEEVSEEDIRANILDIDGRIRDEFQKCSLILSFNPTYRQHWLFEFVNVFLKDKDSLVLHSTHWDNKFVNDSYRQKTEALKFSDPYRYQVYGLGEWGVTGKTVFNANKIAERIRDLQDAYKVNPPRMVDFKYDRDEKTELVVPDSIEPYSLVSGETMIFSEPKPKRPYVLAIDTAGEGVDYYAGQVLDNITGEQVAVFHSVRAPDECVVQLFGLGMYYNEALLVPEINFDGSYLLYKCLEMGYHKIYQRTTAPDDLNQGYEHKYGFRTTSGNRMYMLSILKEWLELNIGKINDLKTLNEMLTFTLQVKKTKGIWWGAEPGAHDDLIMALAICLQGREQQATEEIPDTRKLKGVYFPEELEMGIKDNSFTRREVEIYKKNSNLFGENYMHKEKKKRSRYGR